MAEFTVSKTSVSKTLPLSHPTLSSPTLCRFHSQKYPPHVVATWLSAAPDFYLFILGPLSDAFSNTVKKAPNYKIKKA